MGFRTDKLYADEAWIPIIHGMIVMDMETVTTSPWTMDGTKQEIKFKSSSPITANLIATAASGKTFFFVNKGAGAVTLTPAGADTIMSNPTQQLNSGEALILCDDEAGDWSWF